MVAFGLDNQKIALIFVTYGSSIKTLADHVVTVEQDLCGGRWQIGECWKIWNDLECLVIGNSNERRGTY